MRWIALLTALTCVVTLLGCSGVSKPTPGIFGKVISKGTRQPIANATVKVFSGDVEVASVTTNGRFVRLSKFAARLIHFGRFSRRFLGEPCRGNIGNEPEVVGYR